MKIRTKKIAIVLMAACISVSGLLAAPAYEVHAMASETETVMPMADKLVWKYKIINGVMYKRLYNQSTKKWVGNWIKC
mgnify:CR=1 FL=1